MRYDSEMKEKLDPMTLAKFGEGSYEITNGKVFNMLGFMRSGNSSILYSGDGALQALPLTEKNYLYYSSI